MEIIVNGVDAYKLIYGAILEIYEVASTLNQNHRL